MKMNEYKVYRKLEEIIGCVVKILRVFNVDRFIRQSNLDKEIKQEKLVYRVTYRVSEIENNDSY